MPKHELFCSDCGQRMVLQCKTADEANSLIDNENRRAVAYNSTKQEFIVRMSKFLHDSMVGYGEHTKTCREHTTPEQHARDIVDICSVFAGAMTILEGVSRATIRRECSNKEGTLSGILYIVLEKFDEFMLDRGFANEAQNEELMGAAQAAAYSADHKRRDNTPRQGH